MTHPLLKEAVSKRDEPLIIESVVRLVKRDSWGGNVVEIAISVPRVRCLERELAQ